MAFHLRPRSFGRGAAALAAGALVVGLAGCQGASPAPTGIQSPTASATASSDPNAEWGGYGSRDEACAAVAGDVLTLALVPKNLALVDADGGVDDIDDTIREAAVAAPGAIAPNYLQLSALVEAYGRDLAAWSRAVDGESTGASGSATPAPTAGSTGPTGSTPGGTSTAASTPTPTPSAPERPEFADTRYNAQLDSIKTWLSDTCG
ncbi:hypothetical protein C5B96_02450 [Subtercola sp. Z020]|uniref:hypothetical protein n=1 Tax=Subtercola sp. Z020 TaxID=2080582 RepID=UPI000CE737B0|nr:hypothetical protein [Subtercola sp. Z020]PPF88525.1 hypothetical protein C5B96_02450 [Subtercola sp. Z020]